MGQAVWTSPSLRGSVGVQRVLHRVWWVGVGPARVTSGGSGVRARLWMPSSIRRCATGQAGPCCHTGRQSGQFGEITLLAE